MRRPSYTLYLILFSLLASLNLSAQTEKIIEDSLLKRFDYYSAKNSSSVLFTHFDKNVYLANEDVWFTTYLLNYNKKINNPTVLSVLLINNLNKSLALRSRFVMADGLSFGNVVIPDIIMPGDYTFVLYTNIVNNGMPVDVFVQPISIQATSQPSIVASLSLLDTDRQTAKENFKVQLKVSTRQGKIIPNAEVSYYIGNYEKPISLKKIKTDKDGRYLFSIPAEQITDGSNTLYVSINYNNEQTDSELKLPFADAKLSVKFYPEGGSLVHGAQSIVGWEAKDARGNPQKVSAVLYKNKQPVDTINTDSFGMGRFKLIPLTGSSYEAKLSWNGKDTIYQLPGILQKGVVININNAVVNDSLRIKLTSKYPGKFYLAIHNYRQLYFIVPVNVGAVGKTVLFNLRDVNKGLNMITVLDSLQQPMAERLFFAHNNQLTPVNITTDKSSYTTKQKVNLNIKFDVPGIDTVKGMVSVACVQSNRIEIKNKTDIESYFYLISKLGRLPVTETYIGRSVEDKEYLENVLLIKGWSKYKWQELNNSTTKDTIAQFRKLKFAGSVSFNGNPINKPRQVMVKTDSTSDIIYTDVKGNFVLDDIKMIVAQGGKINLLISKSKTGYALIMDDSYNKVDLSFIGQAESHNKSYNFYNVIGTAPRVLTGLEHVFNLKNVTIRGEKDDYYGRIQRRSILNGCGDYVCRYNVLNCKIHKYEKDNRPPKIGEVYGILDNDPDKPKGGVMHRSYLLAQDGNYYDVVTYLGCTTYESNPAVLSIDGVYYSKEFYGEDYSKNSQQQFEYQSTIYWKHLCFVNSKGETNLSFYTNDATGSFKIIVQGVSNKDVIYGEKEFTVKRP